MDREQALPRATWEGVEAAKGGGKRWNVRGWRQQKGWAKVEREQALPRATQEGVEAAKGVGKGGT